ncbi:BTAD domain-containing putative transcriptional regulator [Thermomonospora cellulosilytica]|uniref:Putative ATPase/DNA-binding SARP family transcriptional activator n=1 Tax=Thermomonospora cellulosilytica TaxID=1411118 RepID=A0A7W3MTS6_9ACTN|nr:BTAD domain-containing putative transcriptional regulator [Thermomonospora cellulosilytica]MBA9001717.1 putative ATPase/DNA-binding SARP family transcriptional activator [Thermomonospora cellulosilytica]
MRFGVLGPPVVWTDGGEPVTVPEAKVRRLLADLLAHRGRPVPAGRLIFDLWGDRPPRNPSGTLQARVSQLRRALEDAEPGARALVVSGPAGYALHVEPEAVDADRFAALLSRAREAADPASRARLLTEALALWRGPAFDGVADEDFARAEAAGLEELRLLAVEERAEARLELGEHAQVAAELAVEVARHPLRERLRAAHLLALYRSGRQGEALAGYQELRERLAEELGADPGPELAALHRAMLRQDPALSPDPELPVPLTELIGRDDEIRRTAELLAGHRLVTLTGPGGVGKTRLALAVAGRAAHPDGVRLVELASLPPGAGEEEVAEAVAAALDVRDDHAPGPRPARGMRPVDRLAAAVRARRMLLVLDNCEHLVEAAAVVAQRLLAAAPGLRVLATGREPLGLAGERVLPVPPLDLPGPQDDPAESGAVRLFVARATAADPAFAFDPGAAPAVAAICTRLDGLPLALELAATRVRALGVHELAARLDDRFRLLAGGRRDAPARHRTLRAVIDWSWEPLPEPERAVLRRLAVHADGCTLRAAEAVCAGDGVPAADVPELLARLVDRSLVVVTRTRGETRYRLLESVAAYCHERLEAAGETARVRARHLDHYLDLAERAEPALRGRAQRRTLALLDAESANLRTALEHAADPGRALRLVNALAWYWYLRGRIGEARRSFAQALSIDGPVPDDLRAQALAWQAGMVMAAGEDPGEFPPPAPGPGGARAEWFRTFVSWAYRDLREHEERVDHVLAAFREFGDRWGEAAALVVRAKLALGRGSLTRLERDAEHGLALFRELGDDWGVSEAVDTLGMYAEIVGDYDRAARLHTEGLRLAEAHGIRTRVSFALSRLGRIAMLTGDLDRSRDLHERAARLAAEHADKSAEEFAGVGLALVARRQGRLDEAERRLRQWLPWLRQINGDPGVSFVLAELGFVAEQRGDAAEALELHREALAAAGGTRLLEDGTLPGDAEPRAAALALEGLAGAYSLAGDPHRAARLLSMAAGIRASVGAPLPAGERGDVDRITRRIHDMLGAEAV